MAKSERDKLAAKARKMTTATQKGLWRFAFLRVLDRLGARGKGNETAREAMLRALVDGKTIAEAERLALESVFPPCPVPLPESES